MSEDPQERAAVDAAELLHAAPAPPMSLNVRLDTDTGLVRLDFSTPTSSVSMDATAARAMAKALRQAANEADRTRGAPPRMPKRQAFGRARW